ncbi:energy transducer TonB [Hymenobacter psoromatis]|uniref:energy transducer TonB n=1 Tax=Hymenobacter psoromatis TaxID=1484116 RepID=UPI001CC14324|nr:energy transducer TonB [Hymenobacter psoromatis]
MSLFLQKPLRLVLLGSIAFFVVRPVAAQTVAVPAKAETQYVYVEKLPELPGGGGEHAVVTAIQQRVIYPPAAIREQLEGRTKVWFVVKADGGIGAVRITESLRADCDSAVVEAVRQLPHFEPGIIAGKPSAIGYTIPITFRLQKVARPHLGVGSGN